MFHQIFNMKYFISFLLVLSFVSCEQTQKKSNNLKIDPTTIGAITRGKVWTPLKNFLKGKELNKESANKKPRLNYRVNVTTENFIERHLDSKKTPSKINLL